MDLESLDQDGDKDLLLEIDDTIGRFILDTYIICIIPPLQDAGA